MASLRGVMLFSRDVVRSAALFEQGLGLAVSSCTPKFAEISGGSEGQSKIYLLQRGAKGKIICRNSIMGLCDYAIMRHSATFMRVFIIYCISSQKQSSLLFNLVIIVLYILCDRF